MVSVSENHALVWLDLLGIKWSFDKAFFNGEGCSVWIRTFALDRSSFLNLQHGEENSCYYSEIGFLWFVIRPPAEPGDTLSFSNTPLELWTILQKEKKN